jgi:hypothetical protein
LKATGYGLLWGDRVQKAQDHFAARCVLWPLFQLAVPFDPGVYHLEKETSLQSLDWWHL